MLAKRITDLSLFSGLFLFLLGFGTFQWINLLYYRQLIVNGTFNVTLIDNLVMFIGIALTFASLAVMKLGSRPLGFPSRGLAIDFMFVTGSFLFVIAQAFLSGAFGVSLLRLDVEISYMFVGLALFFAGIFMWYKESKRHSRAGLRWEILVCVSILLTLLEFFSTAGKRRFADSYANDRVSIRDYDCHLPLVVWGWSVTFPKCKP